MLFRSGVGPDRDRTLNRLVWFQNVQDSTLRYSRIHHGGGECVRLKANSQRNELHHNEVSDCGYYQFEIQKQERLNKNGEAIYVGTDPTQIAETQINRQRYWGLDPALVSDRSSFNHIHHNVLRPGPPGADWGNECVDLKEDWPEPQADRPGDAERGEPGHNVVADNECSGQFDPESGAFDSRGPNNVFEHNLVTGTVQEDFGFDEYRVSVGTGLRIKIPFLGQAPFALDFAFPLLKEEDDEVQSVSFDLSVPF